ncbi:hypothetical protein [Humidesulfovibrio idahonensis]
MPTPLQAHAARINSKYLNSMNTAPQDSVLSRVRDIWWPSFIQAYEATGVVSLDRLDMFMDQSRTMLNDMAHAYARDEIPTGEGAKFLQLVNQFLKSNTGKMFERFVGLTIAHHLKITESNYCIWPFRNDMYRVDKRLQKEKFSVSIVLGGIKYSTPIDADLIIFSPEQDDKHIFMVSIKSTLKDRFHNVPFWNLLRVASTATEITHITTDHGAFIDSVKYISICTDLAEQQPDFAADGGPRNLLCFDASLLDGAFVTASRARGVTHSDNCLGSTRDAPFHRLSSFMSQIS